MEVMGSVHSEGKQENERTEMYCIILRKVQNSNNQNKGSKVLNTNFYWKGGTCLFLFTHISSYSIITTSKFLGT